MDAPRQLSEKAKGKRRAIEPDEDVEAQGGGSSSREDPGLRTVTIRFTEGVEDLTLVISDTDTVREVKKKIRLQRTGLENRRLRLIHSGRLLTDGTYLYGWLKSLEEHQRRAQVESEDTSTWLHCSIGMEGDEEDTKEPKAQMTPLRGFDRLMNAGFTEEDIATIRRQFRISRGLEHNGGSLDDDEDEHARALEEQWIDNLDGGALDPSLDATPDGLYTTLLEGVMTGFFFGFTPFFFMRQARAPAFFSDEFEQIEHQSSVLFSKRMQMALVIGLFVNIMIGILKYAY
ncbi:hypothetical protein FRB99_005303 [Tulasnella sp. 403]|nr:hypothetical protein FRB99_005303 [Tulasnella sp. 403]